MEKELKKIKLQTLKNGYSLAVGEHEYMYFNLGELVEGFLYHVAFEEASYINKNEMRKYVEAAVAWRADGGETAKKMLELEEEKERLKSTILTNNNVIKRLKDKISFLQNGGKKSKTSDVEDDEDE
jgi:hypothetical protein